MKPNDPQLSIRRQCEILEISRAGYYRPRGKPSTMNLKLMRLIDEEYTRHPFLGARKMGEYLKTLGHRVNVKRVRRLMRQMGIMAIYPKPNLSLQNKAHEKYPYLLRGLKIERVNQVWSTDITYIRTENGFCYLIAIIDWASRYVIDWELSNTLDVEFCERILRRALTYGSPEIFNMDQGSQFTSKSFLDILRVEHAEKNIRISMDGKGRALDNVFVERLWRSVKYENIYLKSFAGVSEVRASLAEYFTYYSNSRPHQGLGYLTPAAVYFNYPNSGKLVA